MFWQIGRALLRRGHRAVAVREDVVERGTLPDRERAHEHGRLAEARGLDPRRIREPVGQVLANGLEQEVAVCPDAATENDEADVSTAAIGAMCNAMRRASSCTTARPSGSSPRAAAKRARTSKGGTAQFRVVGVQGDPVNPRAPPAQRPSLDSHCASDTFGVVDVLRAP